MRCRPSDFRLVLVRWFASQCRRNDDDEPDARSGAAARQVRFFRVPLFRLLAINLAAGVAMAALVVGGLLALDPGGLRHLIFADASPGTALGLLLFGFVVTFGSAAMGTAIMAMGRAADDEAARPAGPGGAAGTRFCQGAPRLTIWPSLRHD